MTTMIKFDTPFALKPGNEEILKYPDGTLTLRFTGVDGSSNALFIATFISDEVDKDEEPVLVTNQRLQLIPGGGRIVLRQLFEVVGKQPGIRCLPTDDKSYTFILYSPGNK